MRNERADGFFKCLSVVNSCTNQEQLEVARNFCRLYTEKYQVNLLRDKEILTALIVKEALLSHKFH